MKHRFQLDGSTRERKKKIDCPYCGGKKCFTRYKDYETGEYLDHNVGMCDRSNKCGQHVKPKEFFSAHPTQREATQSERKLIQTFNRPLVHIPSEVLFSTLDDHENNSFIQPLTKLFPFHKIGKAIGDYYLGTTPAGFRAESQENKPAVFWFIDHNNNIRAGQVKLFTKDCRTAKYVTREGEKRNYQTWMHSLLMKSHKASSEPMPQWLQDYSEGEKVTCLFGEHLLNKYRSKPVALVEAPKTAFIASIAYPEFVWLATSSLTYLTKERCRVLQGRRVILFPDCGIPNPKTGKTCLNLWKERISEFEELSVFSFSSLLEDHATPEEKESGLDLADLLLRDLQNPPVHLLTCDMLPYGSQHITGREFDNIIIAGFHAKDGKVYDVLFDSTAENLLTSHPKIEALAAYFRKNFIPAKFNGIACLVNIPKN